MRCIGQSVIVLAVSGLLFADAAMGRTLPPAPKGRFVADEVLVRFKPGTSASAVNLAIGAVGARAHERIEGLGVHILKVEPGTVDDTVRALGHNPQVEFAERNVIMHALGTSTLVPNDPYNNGSCYIGSDGECHRQWAWAKVQAYQAWALATGSSSVKVAVIDTGIDVGEPDHHYYPDLTGNDELVTCGPGIIKKSFIYGEGGNDDNSHGTHVAGTVGACTNNGRAVAGANWSVQLMGVKVLDWSGSGTSATIANGILWAADNGAKVINLSLGGEASQTVEAAVNYAWNKGSVLVCAAGNDGTPTRMYPAAYTNCIAVAATDENDAKASFSNHGADWVDVAAPGVNILSTMQDDIYWCSLCYLYGLSPYLDALSGTSMAAPHVAGLAALIWSSGKCTTASCVRDRIENNTDAISGTGVYWSKGRVNYYKAVSAP